MTGLVALALLSSPWDNPVKLTGELFIRAYQLVLSEQQPDACNFRPTCSRFSREAIKRYGPVGVAMTFDRLLRDNPGAWSAVGVWYSTERGKLHDTHEDYYLFGGTERDDALYYLDGGE